MGTITMAMATLGRTLTQHRGKGKANPAKWNTSRRTKGVRLPAHRQKLGAARVKHEEGVNQKEITTPETTTEKYGLEVGLFKTLTDKSASKTSKTENAKALLAKYGSAYLLTSISFALVSFAICYFLVSAGIDVSALLSKVSSDSFHTDGRFSHSSLVNRLAWK